MLTKRQMWADYEPPDTDFVADIAPGTIGVVLRRSFADTREGTLIVLFANIGIRRLYVGHGEEGEWTMWYTRLWSVDEES